MPSRICSPVTRTLFGALLSALAAAIVLPAAAPAQILPDLPMVHRIGVGARALGMAGAFAAIGDDASGLYYNPAGLAQLRATEFSGSVQSRSVQYETTYAGNGESSDLDKSRIHSFSFGYPFPTWRGGLAIGFAYHRVGDFDQDYYRRGSGGAIQSEEESILEEGGLGAYQAGFAVQVSPTLSLGITGSILAGTSTRDRDFRYEEAGSPDYEITTTSTELDLVAISGTLGAMYHAAPFRLGLALHLPESYSVDGRSTEDVRRYQQDGDTLDYYDPDIRFEDEIDLPFRTSLGLAVSPALAAGELTVSVQWDYADWQQIDYAGLLRTDDREYAYRSTHDLRFGVEFAPARLPLRLRAGYLHQPLAYRLIATDVFMGSAGVARIDSDRRYFTFGAGLQLDPTFRIDAAYLTGGFERSGVSGRPGPADSRPATSEKVDDSRFLLGATFAI